MLRICILVCFIILVYVIFGSVFHKKYTVCVYVCVGILCEVILRKIEFITAFGWYERV